jgi:hypothetical protein
MDVDLAHELARQTIPANSYGKMTVDGEIVIAFLLFGIEIPVGI